MIDLEILEDGKCILNRNVSKGEIITYQNSYLKKHDKVEKVQVLTDLKIYDILYAGVMTVGKVVIEANKDTDSYLVVKKQN